MLFLRIIAISLPQLLLILDLGAKHDLLFGFNRADAGFSTLLALFILAPLLNLVWLVSETAHSVLLAKRRNGPVALRIPALALSVLVEALLIDLYLLSQAKM